MEWSACLCLWVVVLENIGLGRRPSLGELMNESIREIKNFFIETWAEAPWIRAAGIIGSTLAGLVFLNSALPQGVAIEFDTLETEVYQAMLTSLLVLYFFLVSVFSGDRLRFEKRLRSLEQSFRYDNRGTLYNGKEPNIAFRIATFKGMLESISGVIGADELSRVLTNTGRLAGTDFARSLKDIYNSDIASKKAKLDWDELSLSEKLDQWAEYDSSTGWGILACKVHNDSVKVVINHLQGLFDGNGGLMFGYFLAGYSETIITYIIDTHKGGKFNEYSKAALIKANQSDKYTLELSYQLS